MKDPFNVLYFRVVVVSSLLLFSNEMGELLHSARHCNGEVIEARHLCGTIGTKGEFTFSKSYEIGAPSAEVRPSHSFSPCFF